MLTELLPDLGDRGVALHLADVKGPVRDVLRRAGIWDELGGRVHASTFDAVSVITCDRLGPSDQRRSGIDEHYVAPVGHRSLEDEVPSINNPQKNP
jgi:SulP family sulfate permease